MTNYPASGFTSNISQTNSSVVTGTVTFLVPTAGDTITVAGVGFAGVASGASGTQWNVGSTTVSATNFAAALNGYAPFSGLYSANAVGAVVTIIPTARGAWTLTTSNAGHVSVSQTTTPVGNSIVQIARVSGTVEVIMSASATRLSWPS